MDDDTYNEVPMNETSEFNLIHTIDIAGFKVNFVALNCKVVADKTYDTLSQENEEHTSQDEDHNTDVVKNNQDQVIIKGYKINTIQFRLICKHFLQQYESITFEDCVIMLSHRRFQQQVHFKQCQLYIVSTNNGKCKATFINVDPMHPRNDYIGFYTGLFDIDAILDTNPIPDPPVSPRKSGWFNWW